MPKRNKKVFCVNFEFEKLKIELRQKESFCGSSSSGGTYRLSSDKPFGKGTRCVPSFISFSHWSIRDVKNLKHVKFWFKNETNQQMDVNLNQFEQIYAKL